MTFCYLNEITKYNHLYHNQIYVKSNAIPPFLFFFFLIEDL